MTDYFDDADKKRAENIEVPKRRRVTRKMRAAAIIEILTDYHAEDDITLNAESAWELLVAAILAAQATDERVNLITPALFERYPDMQAFAASTPAEIEPYIKSVGLFRNKAKSIHKAAVHLLEHENGSVPADEERLLATPGVGRKIANLLLGDVFGRQAIVVDTHCGRIAQLTGLSESKDPTRIERDLVRYVPQDRWTDWGHLMVAHGRRICIARRPECERCPIAGACTYGKKRLKLDGWDLTNRMAVDVDAAPGEGSLSG